MTRINDLDPIADLVSANSTFFWCQFLNKDYKVSLADMAKLNSMPVGASVHSPAAVNSGVDVTWGGTTFDEGGWVDQVNSPTLLTVPNANIKYVQLCINVDLNNTSGMGFAVQKNGTTVSQGQFNSDLSFEKRFNKITGIISCSNGDKFSFRSTFNSTTPRLLEYNHFSIWPVRLG